MRRISPSIQHAEALGRLQGQRHVRQVVWGPAASDEANPWEGWAWRDEGESPEEMTDTNDNGDDKGGANPDGRERRRLRQKLRDRKRRRLARKHGGGYRPVDPLEYAATTLPPHLPQLTNVRRRLPLRSDVGFPNASEEDVLLKQEEIRREAEMEECSPRLCVLVSSDDLGLGAGTNLATDSLGEQGRRMVQQLWGGGGLRDMPLAGRELCAAWYHNASAASRRPPAALRSIYNSGGGGGEAEAKEEEAIRRRRRKSALRSLRRPAPSASSVFAPPIDSSQSSTQLWRPRPFVDRPAGLVHVLVCPTDVTFDVGDFEPLCCTMALYALPPPGAEARGRRFRGQKVSEDFVFPAGRWAEGMLNEEAGMSLARHFAGSGGGGRTPEEDGSPRSGRRLPRKALFSYDPLDLPEGWGGRSCLHVVIQVFRASQPDGAGSYLGTSHGVATASSSSMKKIIKRRFRNRLGRGGKNDAAIPTEPASEGIGGDGGGGGDTDDDRDEDLLGLPRESESSGQSSAGPGVGPSSTGIASADFDLQFLTPVCFGMLPLFFPGDTDDSRDDDSDDDGEMSWPDGRVQTIQLFSCPPELESQERFAETLALLAAATVEQGVVERTRVQSDDSESSQRTCKESSTQSTSTTEPSISELASVGEDSSQGGLSAQTDRSDATGSRTSASDATARTPSRRLRAFRSLRLPRAPSPEPSRAGFSVRTDLSTPRVGNLSTPKVGNLTGIVRRGSGRRLPQDTAESNNVLANNIPAAGRASLFHSVLGVDFTRALLDTPPELVPMGDGSAGSVGGCRPQIPRLLVDIAGDCAIMSNFPPGGRGGDDLESSSRRQKRSDLVRLPPAARPGGYADDSLEVREVLWLPPRPERRYDDDVSPFVARTSGSTLNLLYLYPRLIRQTLGVSAKGGGRQYSVRIRLVRKLSEVVDEVIGLETLDSPLCSLYNPAPGGQALLSAIFTKVPHLGTLNLKGAGNTEEWPLRDEIKVRLPDVLDSSYYIQFSLFSMRFDDGHGLVSELVGENSIPLSTSTKDPSSGIRATTVIPNGLHRIRLDSFQLQVESRLVSAVHTSDRGVAAVLRDFPFPYAALSGDLKDSALPKLLITMSHIRSILSDASEQAIAMHFRALTYVHLRNLVDSSVPELDFRKAKRFFQDGSFVGDDVLKDSPESSKGMLFLTETLRCLLRVLGKTRSKLSSDGGRRWRDRFLKDFLDGFDEASFSERAQELLRRVPSSIGDGSSASVNDDVKRALETSFSSQSLEIPGRDHTARSRRRLYQTMSDEVVDSTDDGVLKEEGAVHVVIEQDRRQITRARLDANLSSRRPFSRTAYGASRTDQMRAEAELQEYGIRFTELFDDEATVLTMDMSLVTMNTAEKKSMFEMPSPENTTKANEDMRQWGLADDETLNGSEGSESLLQTTLQPGKLMARGVSVSSNTPFKSMAKRVNTVAMMILTPCVAPNLSSVLATGSTTSPSNFNRAPASGGDPGAVGSSNRVSLRSSQNAPGTIRYQAPINDKRQNIYLPGSDVEDEDGSVADSGVQLLSDPWVCPGAPLNSKFRSNGGSQHDTVLPFSFPSAEEGSLGDSRPFLYEVVFAIWLQTWLNCAADSPEAGRGQRDDKTKNLNWETADMFVANMDFLLPICLRSIAMRCSLQGLLNNDFPAAILDGKHMLVFVPIMRAVARGLFCLATFGDDDNQDMSDVELVSALSSSDAVLDFLSGLLSIVHPAQVSILIEVYLKTLRDCEKSGKNDDRCSDEGGNNSVPVWTRPVLRSVRCSRQLRLRAVERLCCIPRFAALNYPWRYENANQGMGGHQSAAQMRSWTVQGPYDMPEGLDLGGEKEVANHLLFPDGIERLPHAHWLAEVLADDCFRICSYSCEAIVDEAVALVKTSHQNGVKKKSTLVRSGISLSRSDLLRFQSTAVHAITCVYELLLRRHAIDEHYQMEESRSRVAAMLLSRVLENSIDSVHWLARMASTHTVRSLWLMCVLHVLQDAPETVIRDKLRHYCTPKHHKEYRIHRFIKILRLCSSTFQYFIGGEKNHPVVLMKLSPWIVQESFNVICAATNILVDECAGVLHSNPREQKKMAQGVLDLLLHVIATPQSSVAHLRALGGASQALDEFGVVIFLDVVGDNLQHWARMLLTLMNSTSLSVRSISVDFIVSLLGGVFKEEGNVDEIALILLTVIPEVTAREIAMYSASGRIFSMEDVESSLWPLRRALADVEETNPADDNRVDAHLSPFLVSLCRTCQAAIDGVLVELRLKGPKCEIVGVNVQIDSDSYTFDADEESLFEVANFFLPETAPMQRLRWLLTLASLHESKGCWVEAAETLFLCSKTIADAVPHIKSVWRPSHFLLWHDHRRSLWLSTVGEEAAIPPRGNAQVMEFADDFLEPANLLDTSSSSVGNVKLAQPTISLMSRMLSSFTKDAVAKYPREDGMESLAFLRLEEILKIVMDYIECHSKMVRWSNHTPFIEESAALRRMSASLNSDMTRLVENIELIAGEEKDPFEKARAQLYEQDDIYETRAGDKTLNGQYYVRVALFGKKPSRFKESTSLPTFLEWETPSICRVPQTTIAEASKKDGTVESRICAAFAEPLLRALSNEIFSSHVVLMDEIPSSTILASEDKAKTFLVVTLVRMQVPNVTTRRGLDSAERGWNSGQSKQFLFKKKDVESDDLNPGASVTNVLSARFVELTVAHSFPCALSRQRTLITSELLSES